MDIDIKVCEVGWGMGSVVPHREPNHVVGFIEDDHGMRRAVCQHHYDFVRAGNTFCWHVVAINELGEQKHADFKSAADSFNEAAGNAATSIHDATPALRTLGKEGRMSFTWQPGINTPSVKDIENTLSGLATMVDSLKTQVEAAQQESSGCSMRWMAWNHGRWTI